MDRGSHDLRPRLAVLAMLCLGTLATAAAPSPAVAQPEGVAYRVDINGAPGPAERLVKDSSQLLLLKDRPPATLAALGRRAKDDQDRFRAVLESEGYYDAAVTSDVVTSEDVTTVKMTITAGNAYLVGDIRLEILDPPPATAPQPDRARTDRPLGAVIGQRARAADVIAAEDAALAELRDNGFPFAARGDRRIDIDREAGLVRVLLPIILGPHAVFGRTHVAGVERLDEAFIQKSVPWRAGAPFNLGALETLRQELIETTLFASVAVAPAATRDMPSGDPLDVNVVVTESVPRTISLGASFASDKGLGASASWAHRNIFGRAENLEISLDATELDQTGAVTLAKPNFLRRDQTLKTGIQAKHADTDAYQEWSGSVSAGLERTFTPLWTGSAATELEVADLTQNQVSHRSYLAGLPISIVRAPGDLLLEQTRGWRLRATITPYAGKYQDAVTFLKTEAEVDVYWPVDRGERTVIAAKLKAGTIVGEGTDGVPANKRLYAGGGGSVRGFDYQRVGPLDANGEPTGGRSLLEGSLEGRFHVSGTIGVVPFIDVGTVSRSSLPGDGGRLAAAAGLGGRYYTGVGPLRLDIAFPLNPRPGVDGGMKYYLSFGQAF